MKSYTVGLIFNSTLDKVLLMEKNRPEWQKGRLNGVGGRIEKGESVLTCMMREAKEEANIASVKEEWKQFATLRGPQWEVHFFGLRYQGAERDAKSVTDERVDWYNPLALPPNALTNVFWLVPLALEKLQDDQFDIVEVTYKRDN